MSVVPLLIGPRHCDLDGGQLPGAGSFAPKGRAMARLAKSGFLFRDAKRAARRKKAIVTVADKGRLRARPHRFEVAVQRPRFSKGTTDIATARGFSATSAVLVINNNDFGALPHSSPESAWHFGNY
jgi:hypothetical protein